MNMRTLFVRTLVLCLGVLGMTARPVTAQSNTTGAVAGTILDAAGTPLEGVQIQVLDRRTGFSVGSVSRSNGRYLVQALDVNGDYIVRFRRIGFAPVEQIGVRVGLSQTTRVDATLTQASTELAAVRVEATASGDFTSTRQGAKTVVSDTILNRLPTLNRNLYDFVRLTPQVAVRPGENERISVAGQNNRLNNIQVDGASVVNRFGLGDSQELGAQAGGRSMTMEAVKEYQVLISPFDVRQGNFTGGLVNAVTKAGTNEFTGSMFFFNRNQGMAQDDPFIRSQDFLRLMYGGSLGGPIIKDKMHFFAAVDVSDDLRGAAGPYFGQPATATPTIPITQAQVDSFTTTLRGYGIEAGSPGAQSNQNPVLNTFARIDYRLNDKHRLVLRNIYNKSGVDNFSRPTTGTNRIFPTTGHSFFREETANSLAAQLFSNFANGGLNEFQVSYTTTRFARKPEVSAPMITVQNVGGANNAQLRAGTENSSQGNFLNENLLEIQNNFTIPLADRHTVTFGTRNELYEVENGFLQNSFGNYTFASLADLAAGRPTLFSGSGSLGADPVARFTAGQFAVYAQDVIRVNNELTVTAGIRADMPYFFDKPGYSNLVEDALGRRTDVMPEGNLQFSPRVGFNWDLSAQAKMQVRGGLGLFQGQPAFVWMSNQYSNSGVALGQISCGPANANGSAPEFDPKPVAPTSCAPLSGFTGANAGRNGEAGATLNPATFPGTINLVSDDLKYPQVLRGSLAIDRELPGNVVATVEGLYTKSFNNFVYENINRVEQATTDANGRVLFGTFNTTGTPTYARVDPRLDAVLEAKNQSEDYSYSVTGQLRKRFTTWWEGSAAYTYGRSFAVSDLTSSVAFSNWQFGRTLSGAQSDRSTAPSAFDQPHRLLLAGTFTAPWKTTDVSFIYQASSGTPYVYTYTGSSGRGDLNADGSSANDAIYIPTSATEAGQIQFANATIGGVAYTAAQQAQAFEDFIEQNDCLRSQRGGIMGRGTCRNPWYNTLDVTFRQTLPEFQNGRLSIQLDIYNFANMIRKDWGKIRSATANTNLALLTHTTNSATGPVFNFNPTLLDKRNLYPAFNSAIQFYQMQLSLRYAF
jgi:outer membrane receptor for ferrienterochelin and colicin